MSLALEAADNIPDTITTDPIRLRQILVNLVGNAIKFTDTGGVRVVLRLSPCSQGILFDIIDTGIGMSEEQMGLLFRPFSQVDNSASRRFSGTGLGLALSKRLAGMLGGDIVPQGSPGGGSVFRLSLATGNVANLEASGKCSSVAAPTEDAVETPAKLDCRILLAEDSPDTRRLITLLLRKVGAQVELAENGQIALDLALAARQAGGPFDIILMDMQMPQMDGYEATRRLRASGDTGPIIALTAHAMSGDHEKCMEAGCTDYISKPIEARKFVALLHQWLPGTPTPACKTV